MRIAKLTESYFLLANCVNAHLLSDFLIRYFGLIASVTKSVTVSPPPPPHLPNASEPGIGRKSLKNLNSLGLPKSIYSLTV